MSRFGGIAVEEEELPASDSRFGGVPIEEPKAKESTVQLSKNRSFSDLPKEEQERLLADQPQLQEPDRQSKRVTGGRDDFPEVDDPSFKEQLYGAVRREVEPAMAATLAGAVMGAPIGGLGAGPGATAGLGAYGISKAVGALTPLLGKIVSKIGSYGPPSVENFTELFDGIRDPYENLEKLYTEIGVPDPKDEAIKTLRVIFQSAASGPAGATRTATQSLGKAVAQKTAVGASEAVAFEAAANTTEELGGGNKLSLLSGIVAAIAAGKKLSPKQVDDLAVLTGSEASKIKDMSLSETAKLATKATKSESAKKKLAAQFAPDQETLEAGKRLGVDEFLDPDLIAQNQAATETGQAIRSYAGGTARSAQAENLEQIGNRAQKLLEGAGASQDLAGLSGQVKSSLRKTIKDYEDEADGIYEIIRQSVPTGTRGPARKTLDFIEDRIAEVDGVENLSAMEKEILKKLTPKDGVDPTYGLIDDVRKTIGEKLKNPGEFRDARKAIAQKMYDTLTDDQGSVLGQLGGDLDKLWEAGKSAIKARKGFEGDMVKLFGKKLDESVFFKIGKETSALTKRDADKFTDLLKAIPEEFRKETLLSAMDATFARHASSGNLSFASFSKWYERLKSNKTAHAEFMKAVGGDTGKMIDDIARVSGSIARAVDKKIATGRLNDVTDQLKRADNLWGNLAERAKKFAMIAPVEYATSKAGLPPGIGLTSALTASLMGGKKDKAIDALNKLLIDPEFTMLTRESIKQAPNITQQLINKMANIEAFARFARLTNLSTQEERVRFLQDSFNGSNQEEENGN